MRVVCVAHCIVAGLMRRKAAIFQYPAHMHFDLLVFILLVERVFYWTVAVRPSCVLREATRPSYGWPSSSLWPTAAACRGAQGVLRGATLRLRGATPPMARPSVACRTHARRVIAGAWHVSARRPHAARREGRIGRASSYLAEPMGSGR